MRGALVVLALVAAGCSHKERGADAPAASMVPASDDAVVATVDGRPIYAAAVAAQARARGVDARTALADLVTAEALAGEAARRGLDRDLDVTLATKGALARRYLQETFEHDVTAADVPDVLVRRYYNRNRNLFDHSTYVDVWHILVPCGPKASPAEREAARGRAEAIARAARGVGSVDAFKALGNAPDLKVEEIVTAKDGWVVPEFSNAAFDQLHQPGDTTGVVETRYGFHVQYLVKYIPPTHKPIAEVAPEIRAGLFGATVQREAFRHFVDEAMTRHNVVEHPERLPKDK